VALVAIEERERVERLERRGDAVEAALLTNFAMADGARLAAVVRAYEAALGIDVARLDDGGATPGKATASLTPAEEQAVGKILRAMFGAQPQSTGGH